MKYQENCECCGNVITAYTHNLNKPLVSALRQLVDFYQKTQYIDHRVSGMACNLASDLNLTHNQLANFQKLQYFGLVLDTKDGWFPTSLGIDFINGTEKVLNPVATFKNEVLPYTHKAWATHKTAPFLIGVLDVDVSCYKKREEYAQKKSSQVGLGI